MSVPPHTVLVTTRDIYDAEEDPPSAQRIAGTIGSTPVAIRPALGALCRAEFLVETGNGYRPTVTAREFLDLDIRLGEVAVVDIVEDE